MFSPFKQRVAGSIPARPTIYFKGLQLIAVSPFCFSPHHSPHGLWKLVGMDSKQCICTFTPLEVYTHCKLRLYSTHEQQGIPPTHAAMYQVWQNASAWNFKTGWKNQRYLPIYLWMWQRPPPVVCQWLCCNSAMEHIRCDLTDTSVEK